MTPGWRKTDSNHRFLDSSAAVFKTAVRSSHDGLTVSRPGTRKFESVSLHQRVCELSVSERSVRGKQYPATFAVDCVALMLGIEDGHCTIYSEARGNPDQINKITVGSCRAADEER